MCNILTVKSCRAVMRTIRSRITGRRNNPDNVSVDSVVIIESDIKSQHSTRSSCCIPIIRERKNRHVVDKKAVECNKEELITAENLLTDFKSVLNSKVCLEKKIEDLKAEEMCQEERKRMALIKTEELKVEIQLKADIKALEDKKAVEMAIVKDRADEKTLELKTARSLSLEHNKATQKAAQEEIELKVLERAFEVEEEEKTLKKSLHEELILVDEELKAENLTEHKVDKTEETDSDVVNERPEETDHEVVIEKPEETDSYVNKTEETDLDVVNERLEETDSYVNINEETDSETKHGILNRRKACKSYFR